MSAHSTFWGRLGRHRRHIKRETSQENRTMPNTRTEVRRAVNEGNVYVREEDLNALDMGEKDRVPSFRNASSDTPTRVIGKSEIWHRAGSTVQIAVQSTTESKGQRWGTGARLGSTLI